MVGGGGGAGVTSGTSSNCGGGGGSSAIVITSPTSITVYAANGGSGSLNAPASNGSTATGSFTLSPGATTLAVYAGGGGGGGCGGCQDRCRL